MTTKDLHIAFCAGCNQSYSRLELAVNLRRYRRFVCAACGFEYNGAQYRPYTVAELLVGKTAPSDQAVGVDVTAHLRAVLTYFQQVRRNDDQTATLMLQARLIGDERTRADRLATELKATIQEQRRLQTVIEDYHSLLQEALRAAQHEMCKRRPEAYDVGADPAPEWHCCDWRDLAKRIEFVLTHTTK